MALGPISYNAAYLRLGNNAVTGENTENINMEVAHKDFIMS